MYTPHAQSGFSLIEVLVAIALLSIMAGIGTSLYAIVNNSYTRANNISNLQSRGSSVMEGIERNIRSALKVTTAPTYGCPGTATECISLNMPNDSIEYKANGHCPVTEYDWIAPTSSTNGRLQRAWRYEDGTVCNDGTATDLFGSDTSKGVSVELINGQSHIFSVTTSATSSDSVVVAMNLMDGISLGSTNRSQVPFITTISLRIYSN